MDYFEYIKNIFGDDFENYKNDLEKEAIAGVRINTLKLDRESFKKYAPFNLREIGEYENAFYIDKSEVDGNHPMHIGGGYYFQEPSAMMPVLALDVKKGDKVLDMCAAPGSKATFIGEKLCKSGILIANEINAKRASALIDNISRLGIRNSAVLNEKPSNISKKFKNFFDKVLVDSPCSGEGMFRKYPDEIKKWSFENVLSCAKRSKMILKDASNCVKPGGYLVYSTCTYNMEENEKVILDFLDNNPDFEIVKTGLKVGKSGFLGLTQAKRIFFSDGGEGQFIAKLKKSGQQQNYSQKKNYKNQNEYKNILLEFIDEKSEIFDSAIYHFEKINDFVYIIPNEMPSLEGLYVKYLGIKALSTEFKAIKPCFELFLSLDKNDFKNKIEIDYKTAKIFLSGQSINAKGVGYTAVFYNDVCIGFGKSKNGVLKNLIPKNKRAKI